MAQNNKSSIVSINVGVVLDMDEWFGKMSMSCISVALSDFYSSDHGSSYQTRLVLHTRDSKRDIVGAAAAGTYDNYFEFKLYLPTIIVTTRISQTQY